jgi:hypothetical protein
METSEDKMQRKKFDAFIGAIGVEIEQAKVKLISAANVQMLLHYWKIGHFILYNQQQSGWGSKIIDKIAKAIRDKYPAQKGYSPRNLIYMCQFARLYPVKILDKMLLADKEFEYLTVEKVLHIATDLNESEIGQQVVAQFQTIDLEGSTFAQQPVAQLQSVDSEQNTQELSLQIRNISDTLVLK